MPVISDSLIEISRQGIYLDMKLLYKLEKITGNLLLMQLISKDSLRELMDGNDTLFSFIAAIKTKTQFTKS